jgi:hypothetical protein
MARPHIASHSEQVRKWVRVATAIGWYRTLSASARRLHWSPGESHS